MIFVFQGVTRTRRSDDTGDFCTFEISPVQIVGFIRVVSIFSRFRPYMSWGLYGRFLRFRDFARTGYGHCTGGFEESVISPVQDMDIVRVVLKNLRFHPYKASQLYGCFLNFEISHVQNKKYG